MDSWILSVYLQNYELLGGLMYGGNGMFYEDIKI